jgi:thioredoxin-like negative regulator of GroEL
VDGLEKDLRGQATVLHIDMLSDIGREIAGEYGVKSLPATLLFDGNGRLVYRDSGMPDADAIRAEVATLREQAEMNTPDTDYQLSN